MLKLAEILSISNINITLLVIEHHYKSLFPNAKNKQAPFDKYPGFRLEAIEDGLPPDHTRSGSKYIELFDSIKNHSKPILKEMLAFWKFEKDGRGPISCIIADGLMSFVSDVANEVGTPMLYMRTLSACSLSIFFSIPKLLESGELPFKDDNLDTQIKSVPGMENFLRRRDLPSFCRTATPSDPSVKLFGAERQENARARGLILNTFDDLEGSVLPYIRDSCPNLYTIGPLHAHLKAKLGGESTSMSTSASSLRQEDRSCIKWLDSQPPKSVIYVSFGSIATVTKNQLMEFWHGLVNSGCKFLWVIRPDSISEGGEVPADVREGTKERGYIVAWAPQEEVLAHNSVGGFWTHSGWNSTLECVMAGKPMLCWPYFMDQQVNSRFVSEVWKLGLDMKDTCDRIIVEKMVEDLMVNRKDEFIKAAERMSMLAKKCLSQGGSSHCNMERLVEAIKSMGKTKAQQGKS